LIGATCEGTCFWIDLKVEEEEDDEEEEFLNVNNHWVSSLKEIIYTFVCDYLMNAMFMAECSFECECDDIQ
jgi:hypothetical protein